jgi:sugar phosphate permease
MVNNTDNKIRRISIFLVLIFAGESIFFLPFLLPRIFRPTLLKVFDITNLELGTYFSVYGIIAMVAYFFGGMLADRYPARNLMATALWLTALGGVFMITIPSDGLMMLLYGYWGFTTIFLFWAALIRATREFGDDDFQGRAFGFLEGGRGLIAALLGSVALLLFSQFSETKGLKVDVSAIRNSSFQLILLVTSGITALAGILILRIVPVVTIVTNKSDGFSFHHLKVILSRSSIWLQAVIIICAYVGYKITDDISLYANEVLGFDEVYAAGVGTMALWMRPLAAIGAGFIADRWTGSKVITWCFLLMIVTGLFIYSGLFVGAVWWIIMVMAMTVVGVYGIRGIYFALMQETKVPIAATGTAVGVMSVVGFTPDVFMSPLMGYLLDSYPGAQGHQYVFLVLAFFAFAGFLASVLLRKHY